MSFKLFIYIYLMRGVSNCITYMGGTENQSFFNSQNVSVSSFSFLTTEHALGPLPPPYHETSNACTTSFPKMNSNSVPLSFHLGKLDAHLKRDVNKCLRWFQPHETNETNPDSHAEEPLSPSTSDPLSIVVGLTHYA